MEKIDRFQEKVSFMKRACFFIETSVALDGKQDSDGGMIGRTFVLSCLPVDDHFPTCAGQSCGRQDQVDPESPVPVEISHPVIPPRELLPVGVEDPVKIGKALAEDCREGFSLWR